MSMEALRLQMPLKLSCPGAYTLKSNKTETLFPRWFARFHKATRNVTPAPSSCVLNRPLAHSLV
jgi:hypothetical protein